MRKSWTLQFSIDEQTEPGSERKAESRTEAAAKSESWGTKIWKYVIRGIVAGLASGTVVITYRWFTGT